MSLLPWRSSKSQRTEHQEHQGSPSRGLATFGDAEPGVTRVPGGIPEGGDYEAIAEFHDVHKTFGSNKVLRGMNVRIREGRITFVIGRSGEGKSVTIKHIVGILKPDKGRVTFDGTDMTTASGAEWDAARRKIGLLFQDGALFDSLSVAENVAFAIVNGGHSKLTLREANERVAMLLEKVGLPGISSKFPTELSIGEKKRVGLARALALDPKLLLYDEPTTGMDSLVSELIDDLIAEMQAKTPGLSSVVISHDVRSILNVAEDIVFLHEGRVYLQGGPDDFRSSQDPVIKQFLSGALQGPLSKPIA